jgi:hypothetical protein
MSKNILYRYHYRIEKCPIELLKTIYKKDLEENDPSIKKKKANIIECSPIKVIYGFTIPKQKNTMHYSPKLLNLSQLDLLDEERDSDLKFPQS